MEPAETCGLNRDKIALSSAMEWTDKKHSLYLKSIESSFVNQLYESRSSIQRNRPSGQFKVLQGGSCNRINFSRPEYPHRAGKPDVLAADPWIRRLRPNAPSISQHTISNDQKICTSASSSKRIHLCHESNNNTEVSDQNFDDEGKGETPSNGCSSKKMKTLATRAQDQVVP